MNYVALLRGINVGGNNIIKMAELRTVLTGAGYANVSTYIQSGNVFFSSDEKNQTILTTQLESILSQNFSYTAKVVVRSQLEIAAVIAAMPPEWHTQPPGSTPAHLKCNVGFLLEPTTPSEAVAAIELRAGVDWIAAGPHVIYMTTLKSEAVHSKFAKMIGTKIYKQMTVRNLNTTQKLLTILSEMP
jgi:uncharacterized protein (DUF1697 family)